MKYIKSLELNLVVYPPEEFKEILESRGRSISNVKDRLNKIYDGRLTWICYK